MTSSQPLELKSLTPELLSQLKERYDKFLLEIISANWKCKFCQTTDELSIFRNAAETLHEDEQRFLRSFRELVPLTVYDDYRPFVARFFDTPCQESEVVDLFAPGLPAFIAASSATSGKAPKYFAKYKAPKFAPSTAQTQSLYTYHIMYREVLNVFRGDRDIARKLIVTTARSGLLRMHMGWEPEGDEGRMSLKIPGETAPHAMKFVSHHPSFLLLHALFGLADRSMDTIRVLFCTTLLDLFMYIERDWFSLVDAIERGTIPELEHIEHVRDHLQRHLNADPVRAAELRAIGPPSNTTGWAKYVWPKLKVAFSSASGPFAIAVPKVKDILGPDVVLHTPGMGGSECFAGAAYQFGDLNRFKITLDDAFIEYLDVTSEEVSSNIRAAWEIEPGKHYELVITTCNGLWRYRLADVVELLGFAPDDGSPIVKFVHRRDAVIKFDGAFVTEDQLLQSIHSATKDTIGQAIEFTCFKDIRKLPVTVGFFVELAQEPAAGLFKHRHQARQRLLDALSSANENIGQAYRAGLFGMPTIRVVKPGTFMEFRKRKGDASAMGTSQTKAPLVMSEIAAQEWMTNRVELEI
ncbi:GH3 auxin-responsive promoter [Suillus lakei]|nr:GH3 auxin-responsive promoter [Suillus lakei]